LHKENIHFDNQSKQVVSFFHCSISVRNGKHVLSVSFELFLSQWSHQVIETLTHESLGELEKAAETLACQLVFPQHFLFKLPLVFL